MDVYCLHHLEPFSNDYVVEQNVDVEKDAIASQSTCQDCKGTGISRWDPVCVYCKGTGRVWFGV